MGVIWRGVLWSFTGISNALFYFKKNLYFYFCMMYACIVYMWVWLPMEVRKGIRSHIAGVIGCELLNPDGRNKS